mmetsp:Transcript_41932/g.84152  ORF Transcript_41932/g.84152 Transcript_41932/m.84152 type:complete len:229 (+) Transcript_41932:220-906(+)
MCSGDSRVEGAVRVRYWGTHRVESWSLMLQTLSHRRPGWQRAKSGESFDEGVGCLECIMLGEATCDGAQIDLESEYHIDSTLVVGQRTSRTAVRRLGACDGGARSITVSGRQCVGFVKGDRQKAIAADGVLWRRPCLVVDGELDVRLTVLGQLRLAADANKVSRQDVGNADDCRLPEDPQRVRHDDVLEREVLSVQPVTELGIDEQLAQGARTQPSYLSLGPHALYWC